MTAMRRLVLLLPLLALVGCREEVPAAGAVKLTVSYSGFLPGCVRVAARDAEGTGEPRFSELAGKGERSGGALTLAVFRAEDWGPTLAVEALAYERPCPSTGTPVTQRSRTTTVEPGQVTELALALEAQDQDGDGFVARQSGGSDCDDLDGTRYPEAPELCDTKDNDCDGELNEGLGLGESCLGMSNCTGMRACATDGGVICNAPAPTLTRFRDRDGDGFGARDAGSEVFCTPPTSGYSPVNTDCDDDDGLRSPAAPERCNGVDDNCNDTADEGLGLGSACTPGDGCTGVRTCDSDGGVTCIAVTFPTIQYPDEDRDGYGRADAGPVSLCDTPPGYAQQGGDCDDGNPFSHPNARELCDLRDNDCDGQPEGAAACPSGGPSWVSSTVGASNRYWSAVSLWGDGGVWIVGSDNRRAVKAPGASSFTVRTSGCSGNWNSVWADPATGRAYIGSEDGKLALQDPSATNCLITTTGLGTDFRSLYGVPGPSGPALHAVGLHTTQSGTGRSYLWDGGAAVEETREPTHRLYSVHGVPGGPLFAVGGSDTESYIYRFDTALGGWRDEDVPTASTGRMEGLWVVNEQLAYAVGWNSTLFQWEGTSWVQLPLTGSDQLSAVLAFGRNAIYAASREGRVYRWDGTQLETVVPNAGVALYGIAGTSPEDIWVVGSGGRVIHWPQ